MSWHSFTAWLLDAWVWIKPNIPAIFAYILIFIIVYWEWRHWNDPDDSDDFGW